MNTKRLINFILIISAIFCGAELSAQGYVDNGCPQNQECVAPGLVGMRAEINRLQQLYARHGQRLEATDLVWRGNIKQPRTWSDYDTAATKNGCADCGESDFGFHKTSWFPKDPAKPIDPRKTKDAEIKTSQDKAFSEATAILTCPDPSGLEIVSQMTLVRFDGQPNTKLVGAAHGVASEKTVKIFESKGGTELEVRKVLDEVIGYCTLKVMDESGRTVLETLKIARKHLATIHPDSDPKRDIFMVEIEKPSKFLKPVTLKMVSEGADLVGQNANMVATHQDVFDEVLTPAGKKEKVFPRVKSQGQFQPMHPLNRYKDIPGLILTNTASNGGASGSIYYDDAGNGVAIHMAGLNKDGGPYNGHTRFNIAIVMDSQTYNYIKKFTTDK